MIETYTRHPLIGGPYDGRELAASAVRGVVYLGEDGQYDPAPPGERYVLHADSGAYYHWPRGEQ